MLSQDSIINIFEVISKLDTWVTSHKWTGFDPYDIRGKKFYLNLKQGQSFLLKKTYRFFEILIKISPMLMRKIFRIKPIINAKAMGLFMSSYATLYTIYRDIDFLKKSKICAAWLLKNASYGYSGLCWGYPFDWQSRILIPNGTPSSVVSAVVGDGFWHLATASGEKKYYDICKSICNFFLNDLNVDKIAEEIICFSYTPLDNFHVHNANLFVAEFLARIGRKFEIREYLDIAMKAGNYALKEQRSDGSLFYWGSIQNHYNKGYRDCYHSGFEIRSLWGLWRNLGDKRFYNSAKQYLDFFYNSYIKQSGEVWFSPNQKYPIDIHACAEAMLCPAVLYELDKERFNDNWHRVFKWTTRTMQNSDGSFGYRIYENGKFDRTPYIRWGQAWIMRALSELLKIGLHKNSL
ncbi:MAG: hypothetical protein ACTSRG_20710 [Candidatus Helarchaeota archaeon]